MTTRPSVSFRSHVSYLVAGAVRMLFLLGFPAAYFSSLAQPGSVNCYRSRTRVFPGLSAPDLYIISVHAYYTAFFVVKPGLPPQSVGFPHRPGIKSWVFPWISDNPRVFPVIPRVIPGFSRICRCFFARSKKIGDNFQKLSRYPRSFPHFPHFVSPQFCPEFSPAAKFDNLINL